MQSPRRETFHQVTIAANDIPRCRELDGSTLRIVPADTEAGWFAEANVITVTDGERTALYVPFRKVVQRAE